MPTVIGLTTKSKLSVLWFVEDERQWPWDPGGCYSNNLVKGDILFSDCVVSAG